jgi:transcriptional regulator with XRE-family HTH domain
MTENRQQDQTLSDVAAERVRELRKAHGWNVDALAERCAEAGRPALTAHVIETIESGRRTPDGRRRRDISVDELHALAAALGVQPLALLTGHEDAGTSDAAFVLGVAEAVIRGSADRVGALRARLAGQEEQNES